MKYTVVQEGDHGEGSSVPTPQDVLDTRNLLFQGPKYAKKVRSSSPRVLHDVLAKFSGELRTSHLVRNIGVQERTIEEWLAWLEVKGSIRRTYSGKTGTIYVQPHADFSDSDAISPLGGLDAFSVVCLEPFALSQVSEKLWSGAVPPNAAGRAARRIFAYLLESEVMVSSVVRFELRVDQSTLRLGLLELCAGGLIFIDQDGVIFVGAPHLGREEFRVLLRNAIEAEEPPRDIRNGLPLSERPVELLLSFHRTIIEKEGYPVSHHPIETRSARKLVAASSFEILLPAILLYVLNFRGFVTEAKNQYLEDEEVQKHGPSLTTFERFAECLSFAADVRARWTGNRPDIPRLLKSRGLPEDMVESCLRDVGRCQEGFESTAGHYQRTPRLAWEHLVVVHRKIMSCLGFVIPVRDAECAVARDLVFAFKPSKALYLVTEFAINFQDMDMYVQTQITRWGPSLRVFDNNRWQRFRESWYDEISEKGRARLFGNCIQQWGLPEDFFTLPEGTVDEPGQRVTFEHLDLNCRRLKDHEVLLAVHDISLQKWGFPPFPSQTEREIARELTKDIDLELLFDLVLLFSYFGHGLRDLEGYLGNAVDRFGPSLRTLAKNLDVLMVARDRIPIRRNVQLARDLEAHGLPADLYEAARYGRRSAIT